RGADGGGGGRGGGGREDGPGAPRGSARLRRPGPASLVLGGLRQSLATPACGLPRSAPGPSSRRLRWPTRVRAHGTPRDYAVLGKWRFSITPSRFPNGSLSVATWMPSPTSCGALTTWAPSPRARGHAVVMCSTPQYATAPPGPG